jgi:hypothetical protein
MASSGMLRRVALVRIDFLEESITSIIRVERIRESGVRRLAVTASVVPSSLIFVTLMMEALISFETSILTIATRLNILEDAILLDVLASTIIRDTFYTECQLYFRSPSKPTVLL